MLQGFQRLQLHLVSQGVIFRNGLAIEVLELQLPLGCLNSGIILSSWVLPSVLLLHSRNLMMAHFSVSDVNPITKIFIAIWMVGVVDRRVKSVSVLMDQIISLCCMTTVYILWQLKVRKEKMIHHLGSML